MSRVREATTTGSPTDPADARGGLLARFGLDATADDQEVETTYDQIVEYLDEAPGDIRGWADRRQQEADRIFALLTAAETELATPARTPAARPSAPVEADPQTPQSSTNKMLLGIIAVLVTVGVVFGVYWVGRPTVPDVSAGASPTASAAPSAAPTIDTAQLAALTEKVKADPKDVASLQKIVDLYFTANDWTSAKAAAQKVLDADPKNEQAFVSLGAASYNGGDNAAAEKVWKQGLVLFPKNPELHYDLGFLYMTNGDNAKMRTEWAKVVELAPGSELAKTVQSQVGAVSKK